MTEGLRLLRVLTRPNVGGPMRQAVALWHEQRRLGMRTLLVVGACEGGEASVDLRSTGIPLLTAADLRRRGVAAEGVVQLPVLRRGVHPVRDLRVVGALRRLIAGFAPDVVHTHTSKAGWLGRWAASRGRVPVIAHTFHGHVLRDYFARPAEQALRGLESWLARRTHLLFAVSPSCRDELDELGLRGVRVVPPAADVRAFGDTARAAARAALGLDDRAAAVGFVGRLVAVKQPEVFLEVLTHLPEATGVLFGDGPARQRLQQQAPLGARFLGATDELPRLLGALDVLVLSSKREGCPLAAIEAFAAGVPVVGFDVPGVRDLLGVWGTGVLVPPAAGAAGLAAAVRALLADHAWRRELVSRARTGLWRFEPARIAAALAEAYAEALAGKDRSLDEVSRPRSAPEARRA